MPVLIQEVIAEVESNTEPPAETHPDEDQLPLATNEQELIGLMDIIEERRRRLLVD